MERNPNWNPYAMYPDPEFDIMATPAEACREYARAVGEDRPDCAWILTDYDTYEANPFYSGPPCIKSLSPYSDNDESAFLDLHAECAGPKCSHGFGDPVFGPSKWDAGPTPAPGDFDDIPF